MYKQNVERICYSLIDKLSRQIEDAPRLYFTRRQKAETLFGPCRRPEKEGMNKPGRHMEVLLI